MDKMLPLSALNELIFDHLFGSAEIHKAEVSSLFKKHSHNLNENGDLSFPLDYKIWKNKTLMDYPVEIDKFKENCKSLTDKSQEWLISIEKVDFKNNRCILYLNKCQTMQFIFKEVLENSSFGIFKLNHNFEVIFPNTTDMNLTSWRKKLVATTVNNVLRFCKREKNWCSSVFDTVYIDFSDEKKSDTSQNVMMKCGLVIDATTKKKTVLSYHDYFCYRRRDMQLIAMHKYGIRMQGNICFAEFLDKLGAATVAIDLLEAKHTSPVQVTDERMGSSKGASFILYNCARLETLLKRFNDKVKKHFYSELPELSEIDLTSLNEEEEWQLVYNFILTFPYMISRVLGNLENGRCSPHLIPQFLSGLVSLFSIYYRRVKILVDNREHLVANLFARIYLLKCVQKIFNISLKLLDIEPIYKM